MAHRIELPEPWEHLETVTDEKRDQLEAAAGTDISASDLAESEVQRWEGAGWTPVSRRAWLVSGVGWQRIRNNETGQVVLLRMQTFDGVTQTVSSIIVPLDENAVTISGADVRSIPIAAISAAYNYDEAVGSSNMRTAMALLGNRELPAPKDPLPKASNDDGFAALVARQYRAIEESSPGAYVAGEMADINDKPLNTVQRWITNARKKGFIPPVAPGRRPRGQES